MKKPKGDPHPNLGASGISRRFVDAKPALKSPVFEKITEDAEPRKNGRPPKHPDKPWEAEGISRMTWYRRRAAANKKEK